MRLTQSHNGIAIIYRIQRKEGGARKQMPPRGFTHLMHSVAGMLSTRNKTVKPSRQPETVEGKRKRRGKIENGFQLHLCMLMLALEWMGMHNDDTIHHMRVGKQRNPSQIGNEQQREDILHYILQLRQDFPIKQMCEDNSIYNKRQPGLYIYLYLQSQIPTSCYSRKKTIEHFH